MQELSFADDLDRLDAWSPDAPAMVLQSGGLNLPDPYPDQIEALDQLRAGIRAGHKGQLLVAPPGWGKTVVGQHLMAGAMEKGSRGLWVVDSLALLEQTSRRFREVGIPHGIYGGGDMNTRWYEKLKVCMAQTIARRGWPGADFVVWDESHVLFRHMMEELPKQGCPFVGASATPFSRGMGTIYDGGMVQVTTTNTLLKQRRLAPIRIKAAVEIDMDGVALQAGEYAARDVQSRGRRVIGDIVSTWVEETQRHFGGPVKTMVFAASIAHGDELCEAFQQAGYDFRQVTAYDKGDRRDKTMKAFRAGDFPGIVSCEALTKGVDVPELLCLVIARPYVKGFASHIQMLGRAMRTHPAKEYALVLDHAGNCLGFYYETRELFANGVDRLDRSRFTAARRSERKAPKEIKCQGCSHIVPPGASACPVCGMERKRRMDIDNVPGHMVEIDAISKGKRGWRGSEEELWTACCTAAARWLSRHNDVAKATRQAKAHFKDLAGHWPPDHYRFVPGERVPKAIQRQIDKNYRDYKKRQQERAA